jgi:putative DNA primase/helicase
MTGTNDFQAEVRVLEKTLEKISSPEDITQKIRHAIKTFTNYKEMAARFVEIQPLFYDTSRNFWLWDFGKRQWVMSDEIDVMNAVDFCLEESSVTSRTAVKQEIIESLKRIGRKKIPKKLPKTWIQFSDTIIDVETGSTITPTPEYFCTNPIPWKPIRGDTPTIDRILEEWVGPDYVRTMKEILAYCLLPATPIHRIFCLIGDGSNGKSKFLELLEKFIGENNIVSTSLERLLGVRFESAKLYKRLVAVMGETNFNLMHRTDTIKRLACGDLIPGEFKGKRPFEFRNYAKLIIATNSLPATADRTVGFYRKWLIIPFPNRFTEEKDVLEDIPEEEYYALAWQCCGLLKELLANRTFTNEGDYEERARVYESYSNPALMFIKTNCDTDPEAKIPFSEFYAELEVYLEENNLRKISKKELGKILRSEGYEIKNTSANWKGSIIKSKFILGLNIIETKKKFDFLNPSNKNSRKSNKIKEFYGYYQSAVNHKNQQQETQYDPYDQNDPELNRSLIYRSRIESRSYESYQSYNIEKVLNDMGKDPVGIGFFRMRGLEMKVVSKLIKDGLIFEVSPGKYVRR